jgi:hypothetical protein
MFTTASKACRPRFALAVDAPPMLTITVIVLSGLATLVKHWPFRRVAEQSPVDGQKGAAEAPRPMAA